MVISREKNPPGTVPAHPPGAPPARAPVHHPGGFQFPGKFLVPVLDFLWLQPKFQTLHFICKRGRGIAQSKAAAVGSESNLKLAAERVLAAKSDVDLPQEMEMIFPADKW